MRPIPEQNADLTSAQEDVIRAVLSILTGERAAEPTAFHDEDMRHAKVVLARAAFRLVQAVDGLPEGDRPAGWRADCTICNEPIPVGALFVDPSGNEMCVFCATEGGEY